jgi:hypothetical protein
MRDANQLMRSETGSEGSSGKGRSFMPFRSHFVEKLAKNYHRLENKSTRLT